MIEKFKKYIFEECKIEPNAKVILAISGGLDSCVVLDLFLKSGINFALAHCNFKLRGDESDENERFVSQLALKNNLPFFTKQFETQTLVANSNESTQMLARKLRYNWFQLLLVENNFDFIATAHHKNDILETSILNFTRGTGISGFHGIKANQNKIIRPLLFATREEIKNYASENNIEYQEDSSNLSTKYYRNLVRHEVIPQLKKINPNIENTIEQTIEKVNAIEIIYADFITDFKQKYVTHKIENTEIDILASKNHNAFVLYSIIEIFGFNYQQTKQILTFDKIGNVFYSSDYKLVIDRKKYIITKKTILNFETIFIQDFNTNLVLPNGLLVFQRISRSDFIPERNHHCVYLDEKKLKFPLALRKWKNGDTIQPFGMKGRKNVSDILVDAKVPLSEKDTILVLVNDLEIIWILGYAFSEKFKIIADNEYITKISLV
ncbi:MAG: tRNA lysidine(34) synthetase TilS [Bacteroidetes bacterium]|nr:MAG: tRNA lysidine(34) synthetase TilS [Bacteroidota bacterium]